jgi:hypothetical protein
VRENPEQPSVPALPNRVCDPAPNVPSVLS